jgi:phosphatidylglycerol:prolipoprotein diacylglycerol transferase
LGVLFALGPLRLALLAQAGRPRQADLEQASPALRPPGRPPGSKIGLILTDPGYYLGSVSALLSTLRAAGVLAFGVIAAILTIVLYTWRHGMSFWAVADSMAPSLALGQAIGRLGCLMAGCCYGRRAPGLPWGIRFTDPAAAALSGTPLYDPSDPQGEHPSPNADLPPRRTSCSSSSSRRSAEARLHGNESALLSASTDLARAIEFFKGCRARLFAVPERASRSTSQIIASWACLRRSRLADPRNAPD